MIITALHWMLIVVISLCTIFVSTSPVKSRAEGIGRLVVLVLNSLTVWFLVMAVLNR